MSEAAVDEYLAQHLLPADDAFDAILQAAREAGLPPADV